MPQVKLYGLFRKHAASSKVDILGGTVRVVLTTLCVDNQSLCEAMFDENGLRSHVRVMVNGRDMDLLQGLETNLTNSDQIAIFPPIAGGS
jgi:molybdopterin synthase sulfur carrier subunit